MNCGLDHGTIYGDERQYSHWSMPKFSRSHGATLTRANHNKTSAILSVLAPIINKLLIQGQWAIRATKKGYIFEYIDGKPQKYKPE
jgi:hypothetical protein